MFITFEGLDGVGKTTQVELLHNHLNQRHDVLTIKEPGTTEIGNTVREILLQKDKDLETETELFLFLASRSELVSKVIKPSLMQGKIVICDRFNESTIAYQGYGRGIGAYRVYNMCMFATQNITPNIIFYLHAPLEYLIENRFSGKHDRIENSGVSFYKKVQDGYEDWLETLPNVRKIDATQNIEKVSSDIAAYVDEFIANEKRK